MTKRYNLKICKTQLLYKFDGLNKINFHQYIDHKHNLMVIIELSNDFVIVGYYHGKIYPKMTADKDALLISVSNK